MKIVVVGSGIAGLNFALQAASEAQVILVTKKELLESNTNYAQGGIAAVLDQGDDFEGHLRDTLTAGAGLCDEKAVKVLVRQAPREIKNLLHWGVGFSRERDGALALTREGGHSKRRIAFAKDATGREIERTLAWHVRQHPRIQILEEHLAYELLMNDKQAWGIQVYDLVREQFKLLEADYFILATGGCGQVYAKTSNPKIATGDGLALAERAGLRLADLEFMQFHPTAFDRAGYPHFLISETLRGEGGILLNTKGERFMERYHPLKELAPRDIVARAIYFESVQGQVYLEMRQLGKEYLKKRFPMIYEQLWWYGLKMEQEAIPVCPIAHYACGGILTDTFGRTSCRNVYAFGEVACTGVHGANRLASNSLMESLVFGTRAWQKIRKQKDLIVTKGESTSLLVNPSKLVDKTLEEQIKQIMWEKVGIVREAEALAEAQIALTAIGKQIATLTAAGLNGSLIRLQNIWQVASLMLKAVVLRTESRGCHYRGDFPQSDDQNWRKRIVLQKDKISFKKL